MSRRIVREVAADARLPAIARESAVHLIPLPTPYGIGDVNTYLLEDDPLTLIDCGPNSATALGILEAALAALGLRLEDIGLILVTHEHSDHAGLARALVERSGTELACFERLAPVLRAWEEHARLSDDEARALMLTHGVQQGVADALRAVADVSRPWGTAADAGLLLEDGAAITLRDRTVTALHRPGHSPSDMVFYDESAKIAFGGDHLLATTSSNALVARSLEPDSGVQRARPLLDYRRSLALTRSMDIDLILGGHGDPIVDHRKLIDGRLDEQRDRADRILRSLGSGPRTAHEIASELWGGVAITQAYLALSEVLGHLDLLIAEGKVVEEDTEPVTLFRAAETAGCNS